MKTFTHIRNIAITSIAFLGSHPSVHAEEVDTTVKVLVKQTQHDKNGQPTGLTDYKWYASIDILGADLGDSFTAGIPVGPYGSMFELYVEPLGETEMSGEPNATKFVSAYYTPMATATLEIISADKSLGYIRTREDEPFAVTISNLANEQWVNIKDDEDTPIDEITWNPFDVRVTRSRTEVNEINVDVLTTQLSIASPLDGKLNVLTPLLTTTFNEAFKMITPPITRGYETFELEGATSRYEGEDVYLPITSKTIKIWPTAKGEILDEFGEPLRGKRITKSMPKVQFKLWHLYPKSDTFIVIYKLKDDVDAEDTEKLDNLDNYSKTKTFTKADGDYIISHDTSVPQGTEEIPSEMTLFIWDDLIPNDGIYSVAVYTQTPFELSVEEAVLIAKAYIIVDRTIEVKGSVITSE
jgi:hypothetical protein